MTITSAQGKPVVLSQAQHDQLLQQIRSIQPTSSGKVTIVPNSKRAKLRFIKDLKLLKHSVKIYGFFCHSAFA